MGVAISGEEYLWPGRTIPYIVDPDLADQDGVAAAVEHWNQQSVVRFVRRSTEDDYVEVTSVPGGANSAVGRQRGVQQVCLGEGCPVGSIIHELGHTVGLWHEHCRHDRDTFVTVLFPKIDKSSWQNFAIDSIANQPTPTTDVGDYDFGSIMHYSETACAFIDDTPVLVPKQPLPPGVVQGQRDGLSPGDIASVAALYADVAPAAGS